MLCGKQSGKAGLMKRRGSSRGLSVGAGQTWGLTPLGPARQVVPDGLCQHLEDPRHTVRYSLRSREPGCPWETAESRAGLKQQGHVCRVSMPSLQLS